ncbi:hypothetical protein GCM10009555_100230 [Acrocarpospora macrocephala]|uniref:Uncharacterized protein n=1 Tax=Acrocarpospora macrocephala TaxID=150177 RepID=A0A5M3X8S4_9ACTN|nr:hypothetical protein Amac_101670 [Acrocarpospora macrocephala]
MGGRTTLIKLPLRSRDHGAGRGRAEPEGNHKGWVGGRTPASSCHSIRAIHGDDGNGRSPRENEGLGGWENHPDTAMAGSGGARGETKGLGGWEMLSKGLGGFSLVGAYPYWSAWLSLALTRGEC